MKKLLAALTPPTDWDGLFYHLTWPAWALDAGRIGPPPVAVPHFSFPGLMESLFLLAMAVLDDVAAKLVHWLFALLLGGLVYRLTNIDRKVCFIDGVDPNDPLGLRK